METNNFNCCICTCNTETFDKFSKSCLNLLQWSLSKSISQHY